jgi:hypothetical protein
MVFLVLLDVRLAHFQCRQKLLSMLLKGTFRMVWRELFYVGCCGSAGVGL